MSSSPAPVPRRSVSLPVSTPTPQIEVLCALPTAKIISFSTSRPLSRPSSSHGSPIVDEEPGTLPCSSRFERLIAAGPLRIYRAPGSVAFLNCLNALRPILPKSQCWEVNQNGAFVLQIRKPQYWRIELPTESDLEKLQVEELKSILAKILLFEKTPCPFEREFTSALPESPLTPVKKRPWRPRLNIPPVPTTTDEVDSARSLASENRALVSVPESARLKALAVPSSEPLVRTQESDALQSTKTNSITVSNLDSQEGLSGIKDGVPQQIFDIPYLHPSNLDNGSEESICSSAPSVEDDSDTFSDTTSEDTNMTPRSHLQPAFQPMTLELDGESRTRALENCSKPIMAPPVLSLVTSPPSKSTKSKSVADDSESTFSSSVESFHSMLSWHSPLAPPSPPLSSSTSPPKTIYPYPHENIVLSKSSQHTRDASELTVTPDTPYAWELSPITDSALESLRRSLPEPPKTPPILIESSEKSEDEPFEILTPPSQSMIRHRPTTGSNSRRRELSPLPAAVNLFTPSRRQGRRLQTARHLPTAIIQKTCGILLSPPSHLLQLMISIASKIAAGEWRGVISGHGEAVHWDFEDEYDDWAEDDYGISIPQQKKKAPSSSGGSWEVD